MKPVGQKDIVDKTWQEFHESLGLTENDLLSISQFDKFRRVYAKGSIVYKVVVPALQQSAHLRANSLQEEYELVSKLRDLDFVPLVKKYYEHGQFEILELKFEPGEAFSDWSGPTSRMLKSLFLVLSAATKLSARGLSHNDLLPTNIVVGEHNRIVLLDFDQATVHNPVIAFLRSVIGIRIGDPPVHKSALGLSLLTFARAFAKPFPMSARNRVKRMLGIAGEATLPALDANASESAKKLRQAWQIAQNSAASAPGQTLAYYELRFDDYVFPGERSWDARWTTLRGITDYKGKAILELGCNMALLSSYLLKYGGALKSLAVDIDEDILRAAQMVSDALEVNPVFLRVDLDSDNNWEAAFASFSPDIVFALNVVNWVRNKDRLLRYLGTVRELVYEGHDSEQIERERLASVGFDEIVLVTKTERGRPVLHCRHKNRR